MKRVIFILSGLLATINPSYSAPIGYASVDGQTTGGAGGKTVTVTTLSALKSAAGSTEKMIIQISGTIKGNEGIRVKSNKTFIGINNGTLDGPGFLMYTVSNIIVRNLRFLNASASDAITIKTNTHHIWVDHCYFGKVKYDGALDITDGSDNVTVSFNHFVGSNKNSLVAGGPGNPADKGNLRVTYYYNFFDTTDERNPSCGSGRCHIFNNYYRGTDYGVASRYGAIARVDNNYFDNVSQPLINATVDGESGGGGFGQFSGVDTNIFKASGVNKIRTSPSSWVPSEYTYKQYVIPAADVPNFVTKNAGPKSNPDDLDDNAPAPAPAPKPTSSPAPSPKPSSSPAPQPTVAPAPSNGCVSINVADLTSDDGFAWRLRGLPAAPEDGDSPLVLLEDGRKLGPANSLHDDIREIGKGRFSHKTTSLRFSSSDNSSPKTNRRSYQYCLEGASAPAPTGPRIASPLPSGCSVIDMSDVSSDDGFAYRLRGMTQGDRDGNKTASNMRLFENTRELGPAHTLHEDIRNIGRGRFSHSNYNLRFSSSDNSNPKSNGRKYIYCMGKSPIVQ